MEKDSRDLIKSFQISRGSPTKQRQWLAKHRPDLLNRTLDEVLGEPVLTEVATASMKKHGDDPFFDDLRRNGRTTVLLELRDVWNLAENA